MKPSTQSSPNISEKRPSPASAAEEAASGEKSKPRRKAIECRGLTKYYGGLAALVDLNLDVSENELFGLLGPAGAGKTTLLLILATLLEPTRGRTRILGLDVRTEHRIVRSQIGFIPDYMARYDDMRVEEFLLFFASAFGVPRRRRKLVVEGVLELTDLTEVRSKRVDDLPRGAKQRLHLARVLTHDPPVILVDEPRRGLEPEAGRELYDILSQLRGLGKTIVLASDSPDELYDLCDRFAVLDRGRLEFTGTPAQYRRKKEAAK